jgi:hypothetical protein
MAALILSKHPGLAPYQVKAVLQAVSDNAVARAGVRGSTDDAGSHSS